MPTVSFATYCYNRDIARMCSPGFLKKLRNQHDYAFNETILIKQNCKEIEVNINDVPDVKIVETGDYPNIYDDFNIPFPDPQAEIFYDGENEPHWWPKHTCNLLVAGKIAISDYIVFSDNDITIEKNIAPGWITTAIECLRRHPEILLVCPGEGTRGRRIPEGTYTNIMSQQIFLIEASRFRSIDFSIPFPYTRNTVPSRYTPAMPQYHFMCEGRIGRYMIDNNLNRLVLDSNRWRYWHHNPCTAEMFSVKPLV